MRKRILGVSVLAAMLVVGLLAAPSWGASGLRAPAPPRAIEGVESPEQPPAGGFCIDINRDRRYTCIGRLKPRNEDSCNVILHVGFLVALTDCNPSSPRRLRLRDVAGPAAAPAAVTGASSQEKESAAEGPVGSGFCLNVNRDSTYTCVLRTKPFQEPSCTTIFGIGGLVVYTDCGGGGGEKTSLRKR
jgi:hypothetical protein